MIKKATTVLVLLAGLGVAAGSAWPRDSERQDYGVFAPGAARQDCRDIHLRNGVLFGECRQRDGRWRLTRLGEAEECRGKEAREDNSACLARLGLPRGSYLESCRDVQVRGDDLRARCRRNSGSWRTTLLEDFDRCEGEIRNRNGRLSC